MFIFVPPRVPLGPVFALKLVQMDTVTGIIIVAMFALICFGFVRKYGDKFKK